VYEFLICAIAGIGAGVATGFVGLSAAVYIAPILVTFLDASAYDAIGIALASDVLASAVSSVNYSRHGNIDLKHSIPLLSTVLGFTIIGSVISYFFSTTTIGNTAMSYWSVLVSLGMGIQFLLRPANKARKNETIGKTRNTLVILFGIYTGFVCGFQGTGGGVMMLFILTTVMNYELKTAVGTSVFIMAFTALIGSVSHFYINGIPNLFQLTVCVLYTLAAAQISSVAANWISESISGRIIGTFLTVSAIIMLCVNILQ